MGFDYLQGWKFHALWAQQLAILTAEDLFLERNSCVSVCAHYPWPFHWAPLERAWPQSFYTHYGDLSWVFSRPNSPRSLSCSFWWIAADFSQWLPCPSCAWKLFLGLCSPSPSRNRGDTDQSVVFWVLLLDLLDNRTDIFFSPALSDPLQFPWFFQDSQEWHDYWLLTPASSVSTYKPNLLKYFLTGFSSTKGDCVIRFSLQADQVLDNVTRITNYLSRYIFTVSDTGTVEWSDAVNLIKDVLKLCSVQC